MEIKTILILIVIIVSIAVGGIAAFLILTFIAQYLAQNRAQSAEKLVEMSDAELIAKFCEPSDKLNALVTETGMKYIHGIKDASPRTTSANSLKSLMDYVSAWKSQPARLSASTRRMLRAFICMKQIIADDGDPNDHAYAYTVLVKYIYQLYISLASALSNNVVDIDFDNIPVTNLESSAAQSELYGILSSKSN